LICASVATQNHEGTKAISAADRDLTEKIATGPFAKIAAGLAWSVPAADAGRRLERWFQTSSPIARRWWLAQNARMQVALIATAVVVLVVTVNLVAGLGGALSARTGPAPVVTSSAAALTQESSAPDAGKVWVVKGLWQGSGTGDTEDFVVGNHWRVDWMFSPGRAGGNFQVFIYRADGRLLANLAASSNGGTDTSFWAGPGKYFLRINSTGGDWKIDVQDLR
jgi:hypothetical protein